MEIHRSIIVTGSRKLPDGELVWLALDRWDPDFVVQGGATGADTFAQQWCKANGKCSITFYPKYDESKSKVFNRRAPLVRNILMLESVPTAMVCAFPLGQRSGTWHTIRQAMDRRRIVRIYE